MPKVKVNNVELHYDEFGIGNETLLFSHGYLMNNSMFIHQIDKFKDDFRCLSFDHRGHGQSESTSNGYELDNLVTDTIDLIEKLNLGSVHFIGMSTGGFVGMRLAIRKPDLLKSMILMDTSAEEDTKLSLMKNKLLMWMVKNIGWSPVIGQVMSILFHKSFLKDKDRQSEVKKWRKIIMDQNLEAMVPFGRMIFSRDRVLEKLSGIKVPTAVIVGEKDVATLPKYNKRIADTIPNAHYYTIPEAGHSAAVEKAEEVSEAMRKFYSEIGILKMTSLNY